MFVLANVATESAQKAKDFWNKQGKKKKITVIVAAVIIIAAIGLLAFSLTRKDYVVLFSGMDSAEAGEVMNVLKEQGVSVKAQGNTILVPKDNAEELRLTLNAQGYPKSGLNYDVFEKASNLGATDMEKNVYLKFQLEQNIMQTINKLDKIQNSTVMITLAQSSQFVLSGQGNTPATASVLVDLKSGDQLSQTDAESIRHLVMRSVPNLSSENITVVDSNMNLYDQDSGGVGGTGNTSAHLDLQKKTQTGLEQQVNNILTPVFGSGKVKSSVNAKLNFDKKVTSSVTFEPPVEGEEQGLIVSQAELLEQITGGNGAGGTVGVDPNTGVSTYPEGNAGGNGDYLKTTREFNAELNEVKEQIEHAQGTIQDLSVAVILDGDESIDEMLPKVTDLVSKAIGVEEENISIMRTPFKQSEEMNAELEEQKKTLATQQRNNMFKNIAIIAAILLGVAAILLILRKRWRQTDGIPTGAGARAAGGGVNLLADEDLDISDLQSGEPENTAKIKKLVNSNPEAVAQLLRNWLSDDFGR